MSFTDTINSIIQDSNNCELTLNKINLFIEATGREYDINCNEAKLKVIQESGTQDDLNMLCEAAQEGLINRVINGVKSALKSLQEFIKSVVEKIKSAFSNNKADEAIDKLEEACKTNPKLKNKKIEIYDIEGEQKCLQEGMDKLSAKSAKIQSGNSSSNDSKDIDDIMEQTSKKRAKIIGATAAITITVAAGIVLFKKLRKSVDGANSPLINKSNEAAKKNAEATEKILKGDFENDQILNQAKATTSFIQLTKQKISGTVSGINLLFKKLKGATVVENLEVKKESVDYSDEDLISLYEAAVAEGNYVTEGANIEYLKTLKKYKKDYKNYLKLANSCMKKGNYKEAISLYEKAKKEVENGKKAIDKIEGTIGSTILSWACSYGIEVLINLCGVTVTTTATRILFKSNKTKLASLVAQFGVTALSIRQLISAVTKVFNHIHYAKINDDKTIDAKKTLNRTRVDILAHFDAINKTIDMVIKNAKEKMKDKKLMKESVNDMTNSEKIMEKVNENISIAVANDVMDITEASELMDINIDLFTEDVDDVDDTDSSTDAEEKDAKEKAKKAKKKLIVIISGCALIIAGITAAVKIYNSKTINKDAKGKEGKKKASEMLAEAKKIEKKAKAIMKKKSITDFEYGEIDSLMDSYMKTMTDYNSFKFTAKRALKNNDKVAKQYGRSLFLAKKKSMASSGSDGFESYIDDDFDAFDSLFESEDDTDDIFDSLFESFDDTDDNNMSIDDLLG